MTHENVISTRLLSDVSCNRTLRTVAMRRRGQRMNFFSFGAWRAPGGRVWLPPKSFVLPPKSIMPLRSRRISGSLYNDMLVLSRKMDLHETVSLFPKKKKKNYLQSVCRFISPYRPAAKQFIRCQLIWGAAENSLYRRGGKGLQAKCM